MRFNEKLYKVRSYIYQDVYHIKRVVASCESEEQLNAASDWVNNLIQKWGRKVNIVDIPKRHHPEVEKYFEEVIGEIQNTIDEVNGVVKENQKEEDKPKKKAIGFK